MVYTRAWVLGVGRWVFEYWALGSGRRGVTVGWFTQALCLVKVAQEDGLCRFSLLMLYNFLKHSMTSNSPSLVMPIVPVETA